MKKINEIKLKISSLNKIYEDIDELTKLMISEHTTMEDAEVIIDEIQKLKKHLPTNSKIEFNGKADSLLAQHDLDFQEVEQSQLHYLIDNFVVKNEITMFAAKPSSGKSLLAVAVANISLIHKKVQNVIYFDADNGITTLKDRNLHHMKRSHKSTFRYIHESKASKTEMWQIIKILKTTDLTNILIVFDSIKNFIQGNRDKNKDVSITMNVLKSLRKQGATIIFLHHTNKPQKDLEELRYAGSSAWEEDTSNAFILKQNEYKKTFIFKPFKNRIGSLYELAFIYNAEKHIVKNVLLSWAKETHLEEEIRNTVIEYLKNPAKKPVKYTTLLNYVKTTGLTNNKDVINLVLQNGKRLYWFAQKVKHKHNMDIYSIILPSPDTSDTSDTSDSSDKSDK